MINRLILFAPLMLLAACGGANGNEGRARSAPLVTAEAVASQRFVDRIDAVGTAFANEQVTLSAPVTERIVSLNFSDGGYVRQGQVIAALARGQENAQLAEANARAHEARQQLDRLEALRNRGFATKSAVDTQVALVSSARAQAQQAEAAIGDRVIRAPFSGWVSLRNISAGAVITAGTEIATISDLSQIKLDFAIPETLLTALREGQTIKAVAAAYPDQRFAGTIRTIDPVVNPQTRTVQVRAILPNGDRRLKPGMMMTVSVEAAERHGLAVPELALVGEGDKSFVFLIGKDKKVKRTPVRTGLRQSGVVEIVEGLNPGDRVVTEGVIKLSDGMPVRLAGEEGKPAGAPQGGKPTPKPGQG